MAVQTARSARAASSVRDFLCWVVVAGGLVAFMSFAAVPGLDGLAHAADAPVCGNAKLEEGEDCDDGDANGDEKGVWCRTDCTTTPCGAPVSRDGGAPRITDALFVLKAAVSVVTCDVKVCDVNNKGGITVLDALQVMRVSVGQDVTLSCPVPVPAITCVNKTFSTVSEVFEALAGDYGIFLDGGSGSTDDVYASGTLAMRILPDFLGKKFVSTSVNGSTSNGAAYYDDGRAGESWEDLDNEVNVFFSTELGTSKILQCDKTTGQITFVIQVVNGDPGFARLKTTVQ